MHSEQARIEQVVASGAGEHEMTGVIKWFDVSRGYGFVTTDSGEDAMLLMKVARSCGKMTLPEHASISFRAVKRPEGWIVTHIHDVDPQAVSAALDAADGQWRYGTVKWFNRLRGFGFIVDPELDEDVFVHIEAVRRSGIAGLFPAMEVEYRRDFNGRAYSVREARSC